MSDNVYDAASVAFFLLLEPGRSITVVKAAAHCIARIVRIATGCVIPLCILEYSRRTPFTIMFCTRARLLDHDFRVVVLFITIC